MSTNAARPQVGPRRTSAGRSRWVKWPHTGNMILPNSGDANLGRWAPTELRKDLSRLYQACRTFLHILDADLKGLGQIQVLLSDTWPGGQLARVVGDLRAVYPRLEMAMLMVEQEQAKITRRQNPATWFLLAVHDLFSEITGEAEPGTAGPLHRFTKRCAALIDPEIDVPESENSFTSVLPQH